MKALLKFTCFILLSLPISLSASQYVVRIEGAGILLDGPSGSQPFQVLGLRCSNALISDEKTEELINNLDVFKAYGINSVSVFFMGSRFGDIKGYNPDASLNAAYQARMGRIIEAADARGMVVLVGCFYWGTSSATEGLGGWSQQNANQAVANTVAWLSQNDYRNVLVDIDNEGMATEKKNWSMQELIAAGHQVDAAIMLGNNTLGNTSTNEDFNCHFGPKEADKPYFDSESTPNGYWGTYSKEDYNSSGREFYNYSRIGVYTASAKDQMRSTSRFSNRNGAMFASTWLQCGPAEGINGPFMRPGGNAEVDDVNANTSELHPDAGIRWWLEWAKAEYGAWNPEPTSVPPTLQLSFGEPKPAQTFAAGDDLYVKIENASEVKVSSIKLFLNDAFVRQENKAPWEWGADSQNDPLLQGLAKGTYILKAVATDKQGKESTLETSLTVGDATPVPFSSGVYRLRHVASGLYLDSKSDGTVIGEAANGDQDQKWQFTAMPDQEYSIDNIEGGRGFLEVRSAGLAGWKVEGEILTTACLWKVNPTSQGNYRLQSQTTESGYLVVENGAVRWTTDASIVGSEWALEAQDESARTSTTALKGKEFAPSQPNEFSVYPNPASQSLHVVGLTSTENLLQLTDMLGKKIVEQRVLGSSATIDLSRLQRGLYHLRVTMPGQTTITRKLLVE